MGTGAVTINRSAVDWISSISKLYTVIKTHHKEGKEMKNFHLFQLAVLHSSSKPVLCMEVSKLFIRRTLWGHVSTPLLCSQSPDLTFTGKLHQRERFFFILWGYFTHGWASTGRYVTLFIELDIFDSGRKYELHTA